MGQIKYNTQLDLFSIMETYTVSAALQTREKTTTVKGLNISTKATYDKINGADNAAVFTAGNFSAVVPSYKKALNDLELARALEKRAEANYKDYEKKVLVDLREEQNQLYLKTELTKEWTDWTTKLGKGAVTGLTPAAATGL